MDEEIYNSEVGGLVELSFSFMVFSDLHYDEMADGGERINTIKKHINENEISFCISLGDFCEPTKENHRLVQELKSTNIPIYFTVGNHETDKHSLNEIVSFYGMDKSYYSFEIEDYKFIVLNTCFIAKETMEQPYYMKNFKEKDVQFPILPVEQLEWLKDELADNKKHIVFSHHSFINEFANRGVANREKVRKLFKDNNVILCMNGHDHGDYMTEHDNTLFYTVNSSAYVWVGSYIWGSEDLFEKYGYTHGALPYKDPFCLRVDVDEFGIKINGVDGAYESVTPEEIGLVDCRWNGVSIKPKASNAKIVFAR